MADTMDELLALFNQEEEAAASHTEERQRKRSQDGGDSSIDDGGDQGKDFSPATATQANRGTNAAGGGRGDCRGVEDGSDRLAASSDAKTGIRMINRQLSGADLMDLLVSSPYHSPASLCSMPMTRLNELLVDPATTVVDAATVCGKTHLITVGVVFSNSGTRMSSGGNAFCVWTLGTLLSGPAISVLLFGSAYGKYCRPCRPGKVVAILGPRLLEASKDGRSSWRDSTAVSFSVSDDRQVLMVGEARDYGTCPAKVRGKNEAGQWVNDARTCGKYVDKSVCSYCPKHRNLGNSSRLAASSGSGSSGNTSTKPITPAMQLLRNQSALASHRFDALSSRRVFPTRISNGIDVGLLPQPSPARLPLGHEALMSHHQSGRLGSQLCLPSSASASGRPSSSSTNRTLNPLKPSVSALNASLSSGATLSRGSVGRSATLGTSFSRQAGAAKAPPPRDHLHTRIETDYPKLPNNSILNRGLSKQMTQPVPASATKQSVIAPLATFSTSRNLRLLRNSTLNPSSQQTEEQSVVPWNSSVKNLYSKKQSKSSSDPSPALGNAAASTQGNNASRECDTSSTDWMESGSKRKVSSRRKTELPVRHKKKAKAAKLNLDTAAFDGCVAVPKPSILFASVFRAPHAAQHTELNPPGSAAVTAAVASAIDSQRRIEVLALQTEMAAKLKELKSSRVKPTFRHVTPRHDGTSDRQTEDRSRGLLGTEMVDIDLEAVKAARSKFADEAAAEDYALMRNRLVELEQQEEAKDGSSKAKKQQQHLRRAGTRGAACDTTGPIQREWVCKTCRRTYRAFPRQCYGASHCVKAKLDIQQVKSAEENRRALSEKRVEDGGLKLGSGLEWSGPR